MANQLKMAEVQAILALHQHGWSDRRIALELGIHRETVGHYVQLARQAGSKPASAPTGSDGDFAMPEGVGGAGPPLGPEGAPTDPQSVIGGLTGPKPASAPTGNFDGIEANNSTAWPWRELIVQGCNSPAAMLRHGTLTARTGGGDTDGCIHFAHDRR